MATKSFGGTKKGHTFTLVGETFHTYPGMSVTFVNTEDEEEEQLKPLQSIIKFIRSLIVKDERERFDRLLNDPDVYIDVDDLLEIARWLVEVTSGRPTKSPSSSGNGAGRTSSGSKVKPSKRVSSGKN
jgi:hypothetical protein